MCRPGFSRLFVHHRLGVAVVRTDKHLPIHFFDRLHHPSDAFVDAGDGLNGGFLITCVAYHIRVGEICDDHIILPGADLFDQGITYLFRAHLRTQVISRRLR